MKSFGKEHIIFSVPSKKTNSPIYLGKDVFDNIVSIIPIHTYSSILILIDENVAAYWSGRINKIIGKDISSLTIPSGDKYKTLATVEKIWLKLSEEKFDRKSLIINIGGGMVCDIGAFAASTYMRGINFIQVPTTLLAQADAAVGGKSGFNFNGLKNTIGAFSNPLAIVCDTSFTSTLPKREFNSGFAEIIKHGIVADKNLFSLLQKKKVITLPQKELDKILGRSVTIKCRIVSKDPFEKKERKKLNFGHTVGHAIEIIYQDTPTPLLHGEAIAIGMIAEARMSFLSGYISEAKFKEIESLIIRYGLRTLIDKKYKKGIALKMLSDKKNIGRQIKWVLLKDIGNVKVNSRLSDGIVSDGLDYILK
jgi:3-dehydroquinate synthase